MISIRLLPKTPGINEDCVGGQTQIFALDGRGEGRGAQRNLQLIDPTIFCYSHVYINTLTLDINSNCDRSIISISVVANFLCGGNCETMLKVLTCSCLNCISYLLVLKRCLGLRVNHFLLRCATSSSSLWNVLSVLHSCGPQCSQHCTPSVQNTKGEPFYLTYDCQACLTDEYTDFQNNNGFATQLHWNIMCENVEITGCSTACPNLHFTSYSKGLKFNSTSPEETLRKSVFFRCAFFVRFYYNRV